MPLSSFDSSNLFHESSLSLKRCTLTRDSSSSSELQDLIDACRQAATDPQSRSNQVFEVGVFDGNYVTPVPAGYFAHLERVRGHSKRIKVIESARDAVANGTAGEEAFQIARNGADVMDDGTVVPSTTTTTTTSEGNDNIPSVNGDDLSSSSLGLGSKRKRVTNEELEQARQRPLYQQDISMHNQHDFEGDD